MTPSATPWLPEDLDGLRALLRSRGLQRYTGEPVSHLEHALQCADLAQRAGRATPPLEAFWPLVQACARPARAA